VLHPQEKIDPLFIHYMDQPIEVSIETLTVCNAACTFCPYPTLDRKGNKMSDSLINRLIDEMAEFDKPFAFSPFKVSDPLLDKRLIPMLKKVNEKTRATIRIFTNASALTWDKAEQLNNIDNLELWLSVNEHREKEYKNLMNLDYQRMLKNVDQLHGSDFRHPVKVLRVGADEDFYKFCMTRWPFFEVKLIKKDGWLGFTKADNTEVPDTWCSRWFELSITSEGMASHCCMHDGSDPKYNIGDVNKQTLLEIYNSPHFRERRELGLSRLDLDDKSPCSKCTY